MCYEVESAVCGGSWRLADTLRRRGRELDFTRHPKCLGVSGYDPLHLVHLIRGNEEYDFNVSLPRLETPVREHPRVRREDLNEAGARWVVVIIHRPTLIPKMR